MTRCDYCFAVATHWGAARLSDREVVVCVRHTPMTVYDTTKPLEDADA